MSLTTIIKKSRARWITVMLFGCIITAPLTLNAQQPSAKKPLDITAYWFNGGWPHYDADAMQYLNEVIIFAVAADAKDGGIKTFSTDKATGEKTFIRASTKPGLSTQMIKTLVADAKKHGVRPTLGINGMGKKEENFNQVVRNNQQGNFAKNVRDLCLKYGITGVDVDYEHASSAEDVKLLGKFYEALHKELKPHNIRLTGAFGVKKQYPKQFLKEYHHLLDQINVMSYKASFKGFVERLQGLDEIGIPREKIWGGIAFYGKDGKKKYSMEYRDLIKHPEYTKPLDIYNLSHPDDPKVKLRLVSFSSDETLTKKLNYLREKGYAGVMIWALNHDIPMTDKRARLPFIHKLSKG